MAKSERGFDARDMIAQLHRAFETAADPERARGQRRYLRDQFEFFGLTAPQQRKITREVIGSAAPPDEPTLIEFTALCWARPQREFQHVACDVLGTRARHCSPDFIEHLRNLVTTKSWWDTVDALASHAVGRLVRRHRHLAEVMDQWIDDEDFWLARTAILHQLGYKQDTDADRLFEYCLRRASDREFFLRKAIGWALRTYSLVEPEAVRSFVDGHRAALSPLSIREATRRLPN